MEFSAKAISEIIKGEIIGDPNIIINDVSKIDEVALAVDEMANGLLSKRLLSRLFLPWIFLKTQNFGGGFDFFGLTYHPIIDLYDFSNNVIHQKSPYQNWFDKVDVPIYEGYHN